VPALRTDRTALVAITINTTPAKTAARIARTRLFIALSLSRRGLGGAQYRCSMP
jgi:hypothetical protein